MLVIHVTNRHDGKRKSYAFEINPEYTLTPERFGLAMKSLTDCLWIVPGTLDLD